MVLISKGGGDYLVIVIMKVMWKAVVVILTRHFTAFITYQDSLNGFRGGCGTGTDTLEVKMIQQVTAMKKAVLHAIFLDLHKAYNSLDRSRCLYILEGYGIGPRALRPLRRYWEQLQMVARAGGYYAEIFHRERGMRH